MEISIQALRARVAPLAQEPSDPRTSGDWRRKLPVLGAAGVRLRELRAADAPTLLECLAVDEVARFISPPPTTVDGFERFIAWAQQERSGGR